MPGTATFCRRWLGFHLRGQQRTASPSAQPSPDLALSVGFSLTPTPTTEPDQEPDLSPDSYPASSPSVYLTLIPILTLKELIYCRPA